MVRYFRDDLRNLPFPEVGSRWIATSNFDTVKKGDILIVTKPYEDYGDAAYLRNTRDNREEAYILDKVAPASDCYECIYMCKRTKKCELYEEKEGGEK